MTEAQPGSIKTRNEKPKAVDGWAGKLLPTVLGFVLGIIGTAGWNWWNGRISTFVYFVNPASSLFQNAELAVGRMALTVDGKPVKNVSALTIYVTNPSGKDFADVPLEINFVSADESPLEIVSEQIGGTDVTTGTAPATQPTTIHRRYIVPVANRTIRGDETIFVGSYVFAADKAPDVQVVPRKAGVVAEKNAVFERPEASPLDYKFWLFFVPIMAVVGYFMLKNSNAQEREQRRWDALSPGEKRAERIAEIERKYPDPEPYDGPN